MKDFTQIQTGDIYADIEQATGKHNQQTTASPEEQAARAAAMQTSGRKGCKLPRINTGFTPDNYEFIKVVSKATGRSMNSFINLVFDMYRQEHPEIMQEAAGFLATVNSGIFSAAAGESADKE